MGRAGSVEVTLVAPPQVLLALEWFGRVAEAEVYISDDIVVRCDLWTSAPRVAGDKAGLDVHWPAAVEVRRDDVWRVLRERVKAEFRRALGDAPPWTTARENEWRAQAGLPKKPWTAGHECAADGGMWKAVDAESCWACAYGRGGGGAKQKYQYAEASRPMHTAADGNVHDGQKADCASCQAQQDTASKIKSNQQRRQEAQARQDKVKADTEEARKKRAADKEAERLRRAKEKEDQERQQRAEARAHKRAADAFADMGDAFGGMFGKGGFEGIFGNLFGRGGARSEKVKPPPAPSPPGRNNPYAVLGLAEGEADLAKITEAWRKRSREVHPDRGGSHEAQVAVNVAYDELKQREAMCTDPACEHRGKDHWRPGSGRQGCRGSHGLCTCTGFKGRA